MIAKRLQLLNIAITSGAVAAAAAATPTATNNNAVSSDLLDICELV